jgi:hypothetical protein
MFSALRKRIHVSPATAIATLALVFAMTGGAYAAKHYLITSTKQISPKVLKSLQGKAGKAGANGAQGLAGAAGPQGPGGAAGAKGETGAPGTPGKDGAPGAPGKDGTTGFTETLPKGKTETGEWSLIGDATGAFKHFGSSASFNIPLAAAPTPHYLRPSGKEPVAVEEPAGSKTFVEKEVEQPACPGKAAAPEATPGNLCVYASAEKNTVKQNSQFIFPLLCSFASGDASACIFAKPSVDPDGFGIWTVSAEEGEVSLVGTWAVTAG